jgi:hypothetical protein
MMALLLFYYYKLALKCHVFGGCYVVGDTVPEVRVRFPALPVVGLEQGPLSLVSTIQELLEKKKK